MDWKQEINNSIGLFCYRNLNRESGPIQSLAISEESYNGTKIFEVGAKLKPKLRYDYYSKFKLYGDFDGTGTSNNKTTATLKAMSEALERWAFYHFRSTNKYGFDIDQSTNGLAAWPFLIGWKSREAAFLEAIERWTLVAWWLGELQPNAILKLGTISGIQFLYKGGQQVVILTQQDSLDGFYHYGFAAGANLNAAISHAQVELNRNFHVIKSRLKNYKTANLEDIYERRLRFFSTTAGFETFWSKAKNIDERTKTLPKLLIDEEVQGEWSAYCKVWRCLFNSQSFDTYESESFFLF